MKADDVKQIAVVGAGLMGHGIAQEFALAGYAVHMHARTEASLGTARAHIERNLDYLVDLDIFRFCATAIGDENNRPFTHEPPLTKE